MDTENKDIYRVLDANINRAREGLRVLEDASRFIFNRPALTLKIRRNRHRLDAAVRQSYPQLIAARDTGSDEGRGFNEKKRSDLSGLVIANFKRVEEAMRVLEEFSKLFSARTGKKFKKIRFDIYAAEKEFQK
jgi:thiamine-phosphate pyrophosphorylase